MKKFEISAKLFAVLVAALSTSYVQLIIGNYDIVSRPDVCKIGRFSVFIFHCEINIVCWAAA